MNTAFEFPGLPSERKRPYDWRRECPDIVARLFPPVVGAGRGHLLLSRKLLRR